MDAWMTLYIVQVLISLYNHELPSRSPFFDGSRTRVFTLSLRRRKQFQNCNILYISRRKQFQDRHRCQGSGRKVRQCDKYSSLRMCKENAVIDLKQIVFCKCCFKDQNVFKHECYDDSTVGSRSDKDKSTLFFCWITCNVQVFKRLGLRTLLRVFTILAKSTFLGCFFFNVENALCIKKLNTQKPIKL